MKKTISIINIIKRLLIKVEIDQILSIYYLRYFNTFEFIC